MFVCVVAKGQNKKYKAKIKTSQLSTFKMSVFKNETQPCFGLDASHSAYLTLSRDFLKEPGVQKVRIFSNYGGHIIL